MNKAIDKKKHLPVVPSGGGIAQNALEPCICVGGDC